MLKREQLSKTHLFSTWYTSLKSALVVLSLLPGFVDTCHLEASYDIEWGLLSNASFSPSWSVWLFWTLKRTLFGPWYRILHLFLLHFFLVCIFSPSLKGLRIFLDSDLHSSSAVFPDFMLAIHPIHIKIYRRHHLFTQGLDENIDLSSTEPQGTSHLLMSSMLQFTEIALLPVHVCQL